MDLNVIISTLRNRTTIFEDRISAGLDSNFNEATELKYPYCMVMPSKQSSNPYTAAGGYYQIVNYGFDIYVVCQNFTNERGESAYSDLFRAETQIFESILGWRPANNANEIIFDNSSLEEINRNIVKYRYSFYFTYEIKLENTHFDDDVVDFNIAFSEGQRTPINIDFKNP